MRQTQTEPRHNRSRVPCLPTEHLPEINGGSWRPKGDKALVKLGTRSNPPKDWDISTPVVSDETGESRWYWILLPIGIIAAFVFAPEQARTVVAALVALAQGV